MENYSFNIVIESAEVKDIRFPTSQYKHGSDAMNPDPDYSAAYVILKTNIPYLEGHGLTFTIGRGNDLCCLAIEAICKPLFGKKMVDIISNFAGFWREVTGDSQIRWLGPEKGVVHLAAGAIINAVWDLYAKMEDKPLWKLLADMTPEQLVSCVDFTYITDVIKPEEAIALLKDKEIGKQDRINYLLKNGYPGYTTSAGWLGYTDDQIRQLCKAAVQDGWTHVKMKVGSNLQDDMRRAAIIREEIGYNVQLMMDANQKWDVEQAIENMKHLANFKPLWIEEPTSPDDILGHATIAKAVAPIKVATGEHCQNRVMFKQLMQAQAIGYCQIDSCRVGGVNENLAILLMAAKFKIPVCPHAGGVGLCEYVQHLSMIDYISISGTMEGKVIEYVDHLHEHFKDPVVIKQGKYQAPTKAGYSIEMKPKSIASYSYPNGPVWQKELNIKE
jgi:L-fuconate dehydratase